MTGRVNRNRITKLIKSLEKEVSQIEHATRPDTIAWSLGEFRLKTNHVVTVSDANNFQLRLSSILQSFHAKAAKLQQIIGEVDNLDRELQAVIQNLRDGDEADIYVHDPQFAIQNLRRMIDTSSKRIVEVLDEIEMLQYKFLPAKERAFCGAVGRVWAAWLRKFIGPIQQDNYGPDLSLIRECVAELHSSSWPPVKSCLEKGKNLLKLYEALGSKNLSQFLEAMSPFDWPSDQLDKIFQEFNKSEFASDHEVLTAFGYHVGISKGLTVDARKKKLCEIMEREDERLEGPPKSCIRLKFVASLIAKQKRLASGRNSNMREAIAHWDQDLEYLRGKYYENRCDQSSRDSAHFRWETVVD